MFQIFILADDLSGAADCGVACVAAGFDTVVALERITGDPQARVLSLDANTRCMEPALAAREVSHAVRSYAANPDLLVYKKIDSTLRGHVAQELTAALDEFRSLRGSRAVAIMAPAFPASGRTTAGGIQFVHRQPLHNLDIWRMQGMTGRASITEMLYAAGLRTALLTLESVQSGVASLAKLMADSARDHDVLVCDAETDADLQTIAFASMRLEPKPIWVGSAGLAYHLPRAAGFASDSNAAPINLSQISGPLLFVIGSLSKNSLRQMHALTTQADVVRLSVPPDVLRAGEESALWASYAQELAGAVRMGRDVVLSPASEPQLDLACRPLLAGALARMACLVNSNIGALVASGGETARAVLQSWGVACLRLLGEVERGVPVSLAEGWNWQLPVITKAGDFGNADTLLACRQFLRREDLCLDSRRVGRKTAQ